MPTGKEVAKAGPKYLGRPYSEMDCQAFVEQCLRDCGLNKNLRGSNAWYRFCRENGWTGSPAECKAKFGSIPPGAFLFIHAYDGGEEEKGYHDGLGNASHIGIYTDMSGAEMVAQAIAEGDPGAAKYDYGDGAIHSSSSRKAVATSNFAGKSISGGWNMIGMWKEISYGEPFDSYMHGGVDPEPTPGPGPEPEPEPEKELAEVWAENGKPVNTRKGPDESYGQSKAGRIPCGEIVEIISSTVNSQDEKWCRIRWTDPRNATWVCWMKAEFLKPIEPAPDPQPEPDPDPQPEPAERWTVTIPGLTRQQAEQLCEEWEGASMKKE